MPNRDEKGHKFNRWRVYFAKEGPAKVRTWKKILRGIVSKTRAAIEVYDVAPHAVEIAWTSNPVAYDSAARLVRLATEQDGSFKILGQPRGIPAESPSGVVQKRHAGPVGDSATASPTVAAAPTRRKSQRKAPTMHQRRLHQPRLRQLLHLWRQTSCL